jgi:hypothetical protein
MRANRAIDTDPHLQEAASQQVVVLIFTLNLHFERLLGSDSSDRYQPIRVIQEDGSDHRFDRSFHRPIDVAGFRATGLLWNEIGGRFGWNTQMDDVLGQVI